MRVLLAGPFVKGDLFTHRWVTPPLATHRIASFLRAHGHEAEVFDQNNPDNQFPFSDIIQNGWDILCFSMLTATLEYDFAKIHEAKKLCPNATIIAGGSGAALDYQFVLDNSPVDVVVTAEGEYPMLDLCEGKPLHEIPGIVFKTPARILTDEDYWEISKSLDIKAMGADAYWKKTASMYDEPDLNEINTFRLFTQNYCPMNCSFCTLTGWRKIASGCKVPVVGLSPGQIVQMIDKVISAYPSVRQIFFVDDDFFLVKKRTHDVLCNLVNAGFAGFVKYICLTNINRCDEETLRLAAKAGFRVLSIGVESTHQGKLDSLNKKQTVKQIFDTTERILAHGIKPYYTVLLFTPYETTESLMMDLKGFRKLSEMGAGLSLEPYLIPLPGTTLSDAKIPESTRWVEIEGTDKRIRKGFAWLPMDKQVRYIFDYFEPFYPKYKRWRFEKDGQGHKEKNYQAGVMLDCLEIVIKSQLDGDAEAEEIYRDVDKLAEGNVDIVGDFTEKEQDEFPH